MSVTVIMSFMSIIIATSILSVPTFAKRNKAEPTTKTTLQTSPATPSQPVGDAPMVESNAQAIKYVITSKPSEEKFEQVPMMLSRTLIAGETTTELKNVSYGLRKKAVFGLVPVRVYTIQLLAANPEKLVRTEDGFLASLKDAGPVQLRMTFLRDLPGQKVADSFKEGLEANKITTRSMSPELAAVMSEVASIKKFTKDESFSITAVWNANQVSLLLEDSVQIKTFNGSPALAENILSIWFGKPADSKLKDLKIALIK